MPFYIVKDYPKDKKIDAVVTAVKATAIRSLFGPGAGSASVGAVSRDCIRYEIRTVYPVWKDGCHREEVLLNRCYIKSLKLAAQKNCETVLIPLLAEEEPAFPHALLYNAASNSIREFLADHEMTVYLLVKNQNAFRIARPQLWDVHDFVAQRRVNDFADAATTIILPTQTMHLPCESAVREESAGRLSVEQPPAPQTSQSRRDNLPRRFPAPFRKAAPIPVPQAKRRSAVPADVPAPKSAPRAQESVRDVTGTLPDLEDLIRKADAGFSETLLRLIDETGRKDSEIYNKANVSRQHFSKIRNNPNYKPTKPTAIAFAIALELNLEQTQDLISRAGYILTDSIIFDVIIMYFIQKQNYNLFDINEALFEFDQMLLGA